MRERLKALRRVLQVHELIEEIHEAESQRAAAEVREAEQAIGIQRVVAQAAELEGHASLFGGDRIGWCLADVQQGIARWRERRLTPILNEREWQSSMARGRHLDSKQWSERMKRLVEQAEKTHGEIEDKRVQRETDDRYLSQRRWRQSKRANDELCR